MPFIKLTKDQVAIVDKNDYGRLRTLNWFANFDPQTGKYYAKRYFQNAKKIIRMEQYLLGKKEGYQIDHINLDTLDNRRSNLRYATKRQNLYNKRLYKNNTLGFKGICRNGNGFMARVIVNGRRKSVGTFKTLIEAARAYNRGAEQYYGRFARLNTTEGGY